MREASPRYAKRLSLISPEALYATKTEFGQKLRDIVASKGAPAAVRWR